MTRRTRLKMNSNKGEHERHKQKFVYELCNRKDVAI